MDASFVDSQIAKSRQAAKELQDIVQPLNLQQLQWKPNADTWSAGQIVDHLRTTNSSYDAIFQAILNGQLKTGFWARVPGLKGMFGNMLKKAIHPDNLKPSKTQAAFEPTTSDIPVNVLQQFLTHHERMMRFWEMLRQKDLDAITVTSPAASFVVYSLRDCIEIIALHEQRHLGQLRRLLSHASFPR